MSEESNLVNVCGMWTNTSKNGDKYMSGNLGYAKVLLFRNKNKTSESSPDWTLCIAPGKRKEKADNEYKTDDDFPF